MRNRWQRLDASQLVRELIATIFNLESSLWRTLIGLTLRPGKVAREYVAGRRRSYFNPLKYLLVTAGTMALLNWRLSAPTEEIDAAVLAEVSAAIPNLPEEMLEVVLSLVHVMQRWSKELQLLMVPLYAIAYRLFWRKDNFAETTCFVAYTYSHASMAMVLGLLPLTMRLDQATGVLGSLWSVIVSIAGFGYLIWAARQFFETGWIRATLAVLITSIVVGIVQAVALLGPLAALLILGSSSGLGEG